jgi:hypothetical protein
MVSLLAMIYRDDRDADQARIASLEGDLARAQERIDELEGKRSKALVLASAHALTPAGKATTLSTRWFGAPLKLELSRTFEGALAAEHFEDLVEKIRLLVDDPGRTELMRSSMSWRSSTERGRGVGPYFTFTVTGRDGVTVLTATDHLGTLAGALYGALGGGVGGGASAAPIFASIAVPVLTPVFVLAWLGGIYGGIRAVFRRAARRRAAKLQTVFDALAAEIDSKLATARKPLER